MIKYISGGDHCRDRLEANHKHPRTRNFPDTHAAHTAHAVHAVHGGTHLEEDGGGGDLLGVRLEAVAQVAAVGQVEAHDAVVGVEQGGVHLGEERQGTGHTSRAFPFHLKTTLPHSSPIPHAVPVL